MKIEKVLGLWAANWEVSMGRERGSAVFTDDDDSPPLTIPFADWDDMGRPKQITVTVQPGDLLNEPKLPF